MTRSLRPTLFVLASSLLATQLASAQARPSVDQAAARYRITGTAVSSRDGAPIPYCRMRLAPAMVNVTHVESSPRGGRFAGPGVGFRGTPGARPGAEPEAVSADAHGKFIIEVPKAGAWHLTGTARNFRTQAYDEHEGYSSAVIVNNSSPSVSLTFQMQPDAEISGDVLDDSGEAVQQAQVTAEAIVLPTPDSVEEGTRTVAFSQTDDRGHYELTSLAPGRYRVRVQARPWYANGSGLRFGSSTSRSTASLDPSLDVVYPITWFPGTDSEQAAEIFDLAGGEERQADIHLLAIPASHVTVPRVDPPAAQDGQSRSQAAPIITRLSSGGFGAQGGSVTSTAGEWDFGGLSPGTYEIRLPGSDGRPGSEVREIVVKPGATTALTNAPSELIRVTIALTGVDSNQNGQITFTDVTNGRRFLVSGGRRRRGSTPGGVVSDDDASASRSVLLPPGTYQVTLSYGDLYLASMSASGAGVSGRRITVTGGAPSLSLQLADGRAEVTGFVRVGSEANAKALQGAMVLLVPALLGQPGDMSFVQRDQTNSDGSFELRGLIPGQYILLAIDHGWNVNWRDPQTLATYLTHGTPLDLNPAAHIQTQLPAQAP